PTGPPPARMSAVRPAPFGVVAKGICGRSPAGGVPGTAPADMLGTEPAVADVGAAPSIGWRRSGVTLAKFVAVPPAVRDRRTPSASSNSGSGRRTGGGTFADASVVGRVAGSEADHGPCAELLTPGAFTCSNRAV